MQLHHNYEPLGQYLPASARFKLPFLKGSGSYPYDVELSLSWKLLVSYLELTFYLRFLLLHNSQTFAPRSLLTV